MTHLPTLRVLAALLLIDPDDRADDDLQAAAMLLARRVLREIDDDAHDGSEPLPHRPRLHIVR